MPCIGFTCDAKLVPLPFDACIKCAASRSNEALGCFHSEDILKGIRSQIRLPMDGFSVTEIMDCPRALYLKKKENFYQRPSKAYWAFRGTMIHKILEASEEIGDITEKRFHMKVLGIPFHGQPDRIRGKTIYDWKSTKLVPSKPKDDHILQLSLYRCILASQEQPIQVESGTIVYLDMSCHKRFNVALKPIEEMRAYAEEKIRILSRHFGGGNPPPASEHFNPRNWKCGISEAKTYCDVRSLCTKDMPKLLDDDISEESKPRRVKEKSE